MNRIILIISLLALITIECCSEQDSETLSSLIIVDLEDRNIKEQDQCKVKVEHKNDTLIRLYKCANKVTFKLETKVFQNDFFISNTKVHPEKAYCKTINYESIGFYHLSWEFINETKTFDLIFDENYQLRIIITEIDFWLFYDNKFNKEEVFKLLDCYIDS